MILGFIVANLGMVLVIGGCIMPRYYNVFIPPHRRDEGTEKTVALEPKGEVVARAIADDNVDVEGGLEKTSDDEKAPGPPPYAAAEPAEPSHIK